jgi:hypothetical protein
LNLDLETPVPPPPTSPGHNPRFKMRVSDLPLVRSRGKFSLAFFLGFVLLLPAYSLWAQQSDSSSTSGNSSTPPKPASVDPQNPQQNPPPDQSGASNPETTQKESEKKDAGQDAAAASQEVPIGQQQPQRILGVMPNFRAVSAGAHPPPPTPKQAFVIATKNSFDYSAFIFVGITSLLAEGTNAHPQLGKGVESYGRYYWRGFLDKMDGNYFVVFALPTVFHQDERYFAKGKGGIWRRGIYAASRILITPDYQGNNSFNTSEILGKGISQGISLAYYPSKTRTLGGFSAKYAYALGRDALTNVFREFWPDIAVHVLHRHP